MRRRDDFQAAITPYVNCLPSRKSLQSLYLTAYSKAGRTVKLDLNGQMFTLPVTTCIQIPALRALLRGKIYPRDTTGSLRKQSLRPKTYPADRTDILEDEILLRLDRSPAVFSAIVDYIQNKELHVPREVCPKTFARDLTFWGFSIEEVEPCCFSGIVNFLYEQDKLNKFQWFLYSQPRVSPSVSQYYSFISEPSGHLCRIKKLRAEVWKILDEPFDSRPAKVYFAFLIVSILLSFCTIAARTHDYFSIDAHGDNTTTNATSRNTTTNETNETSETINDPTDNKQLVLLVLNVLEYLCSSYLFLDYALRIIFFPNLKRFFADFINITDGLAVLANIAQFTLSPESLVLLHAVNTIQLLRILRLLRPMSKMTWFRLMYFTLCCSYKELLLVCMLLMFLTMIFSSLLYYLGDKSSIKSIPHGMWFSLITMTTVGYGDIVPSDVASMLIGSVVAVFGVIIMTMTTPIMVSNFHSLYINAIVGQPSTLKKVQKHLDRPQPANSASDRSSMDTMSSPSYLFDRHTLNQTKEAESEKYRPTMLTAPRTAKELEQIGSRLNLEDISLIVEFAEKTAGVVPGVRTDFTETVDSLVSEDTNSKPCDGWEESSSAVSDHDDHPQVTTTGDDVHQYSTVYEVTKSTSRRGYPEETLLKSTLQRFALAQENSELPSFANSAKSSQTASPSQCSQCVERVNVVDGQAHPISSSESVDVVNKTAHTIGNITKRKQTSGVADSSESVEVRTKKRARATGNISTKTRQPSGTVKSSKSVAVASKKARSATFTTKLSPISDAVSSCGSGAEADQEADTTTTTSDEKSPKEVDDFNTNMMKRHRSLIKPRHRTWYANYETSDSTDTDSERSARDVVFHLDSLNFSSHFDKTRTTLWKNSRSKSKTFERKRSTR